MRLLLPLMMLLGLTLTLQNCKPEKDECHDPANPECENYDPCYGKKPVTAEIILSQRAAPSSGGELGKLYLDEGGDVFPRVQIRFHCPLEGAKYKWTLGAETITEQTFERNFFTVPYGVYTVKLIVEKAPNTNCYPSDDGFDTVVKTFKIVPVCELETSGVYKGVWDNATDSSIVTVRTYYDGSYTDSCSFGVTRFTNLQNKGDTLTAFCILSNSEVIQESYPSLGFRKFTMRVNPQTKATDIEFYISEKKFIFKGRKIAS
ncbi:hypothetical protein QQ054_38620 [Oscillatoria amoena NRMC-F 0135]|nr:hypothetical protein [Oscillatoria amoena NRMC-F 0135]